MTSAELRKLIAEAPGPFYLLEQPWLKEGDTSLMINSPDPHVATFIANFDDWGESDDENPVDKWAYAALIVAAATFHTRGQTDVAEIQDAYKLLSPTLGVGVASVVFAVALLASGQNSTLTGTLAGQIVMEGFLNIRLRPWLRRLITRLIAIIPAVICTAYYGESGTAKLLVFSQVVLSLQLSFAVIPLIIFTSDRRKMGEFVNPAWIKTLAWTTATIIVLLNAKFLWDFTAKLF